MRCALVLLALCVLAAGCGGNGSSAGIEVPKLVGMERRAIEELLASKNLRWRFGHGPIESKAPPANAIGSNDSEPIVRQSPRPGTTVHEGAVIRLVGWCMLHGPCL
jgi:beta-lactam-binding protein with PASTA domain